MGRVTRLLEDPIHHYLHGARALWLPSLDVLWGRCVASFTALTCCAWPVDASCLEPSQPFARFRIILLVNHTNIKTATLYYYLITARTQEMTPGRVTFAYPDRPLPQYPAGVTHRRWRDATSLAGGDASRHSH